MTKELCVRNAYSWLMRWVGKEQFVPLFLDWSDWMVNGDLWVGAALSSNNLLCPFYVSFQTLASDIQRAKGESRTSTKNNLPAQFTLALKPHLLLDWERESRTPDIGRVHQTLIYVSNQTFGSQVMEELLRGVRCTMYEGWASDERSCLFPVNTCPFLRKPWPSVVVSSRELGEVEA